TPTGERTAVGAERHPLDGAQGVVRPPDVVHLTPGRHVPDLDARPAAEPLRGQARNPSARGQQLAVGAERDAARPAPLVPFQAHHLPPGSYVPDVDLAAELVAHLRRLRLLAGRGQQAAV